MIINTPTAQKEKTFGVLSSTEHNNSDRVNEEAPATALLLLLLNLNVMTTL